MSATSVSARLAALGIELPPVAIPAAAYVPFVQTGQLVFLSGHIAKKDGKPWVGQWGLTMGTEEGKAAAREDIAKFNEKNPNRRIQAMQLAQSVSQRQKRIREAQEGVYLPSKRRDALEVGRFATGD